MPSKSKAQQKFMGMVHALKKGEMNPSDASPAVKKAAKSMSKKSVKKYASTKHKGKPVKVNQEWLEQTIRELTNTEMEGCGYTTSAVDPNYKLKSPGGTGEEDRRLKEAPSKKGQEKLIKVFIDNALKKAGIKVIKFDPMRKDFHSGIWGGFYTVKSNNKVDMKGQGKVKRGSAVLPFYVRKNTDIDLGVSSKDFILGKYSEMSKVVKNLKDFKKTDLDEGFVLTQLKEVKIGRYDIGMGSKGNGITLWNRNVEKAGDYKSIAHIAPNGKITNYEKRQPKEVTAFIDKIAKGMKDKPKGESVNELQKMRPAVKKLLKQKGYDPIFHAIDTSKRQFKQMRYSRGEIQDTLIDMFGDEDPKILQKIKESVNEAMDRRQAAETLKQLGGNRFIAMTGAKHFTFGKEGMAFKIGKNSKRVNYVKIDLDRGRDLYNMSFDWVTIKGIKNKKKLKGIYADQLQDMFTKYTGMYTSL